VARGRLENQLSELIFPPKANAANERLAQYLWGHCDALLTFLRQPGLDATSWRAELAIRFGVYPPQGLGGQPDLGWRAGPGGVDIGVAEVLAAGAFGPGRPQLTAAGPAIARLRDSWPQRLAADAAVALTTRDRQRSRPDWRPGVY
jgi:hypothetical protein